MNASLRWRVLSIASGLALAAATVMCAALAGRSATEPSSSSPRGAVLRIRVHGKSLEGNLEGDPADPYVSIYLPPSYNKNRHLRYPVLYLLHGYMDEDSNWFGAKHVFVDAPKAIDAALAAGSREMIIVMPDAHTAYLGSMYSSSPVTGDWETFVTHDLVAYMDSHYRTIPDRMSRGLAGHSMGGYGTLRLAMKYPEVFSSVYALSACCLAPVQSITPSAELAAVEKITGPADLAKVNFGIRAATAEAAAWSPDPGKPPLYFDPPVVDGQIQPQVIAEWDANAPLAMLPQYAINLKKLHAMALDVGTKDGLMPSIEKFDKQLDIFGVAHTFETYDGNHISGIQMRLEQDVIPFFSKNLSFGEKPERTGE
ncbi:MAG: alpha/beta fold hydrolase [Acidobacteriota bacterium]|nr:alpha/beta fold hydrolase [Acidobacteriota bacterium]